MLAIVITGVAYVCLVLLGARFFVMKTAVMPVFLVYALLLNRRIPFLTDWLPLLAGTVLFDAIRGAIFVAAKLGYIKVYATYVIELERLVVWTPAAPLVLQRWRTPLLDEVAVLLHASHFAFFLLFGLVLWHARRWHFNHYRGALLCVMALGLLGYIMIPTVPPWLAFKPLDLLPPITHVVEHVYTARVPEIYGVFATNPVAAMPSLHAAFPMTCALVGWRAFGHRLGMGLVLYALAVMLAIVYLGEHYAVDIIAGVALAIVALRLSQKHLVESWSFTRSLVLSGSALGLTFAVLYVSRLSVGQ
jgi:membrane-associated phospholipid phosphatase